MLHLVFFLGFRIVAESVKFGAVNNPMPTMQFKESSSMEEMTMTFRYGPFEETLDIHQIQSVTLSCSLLLIN